MDYVMAVQATAFLTSSGSFLVDRPFGSHLKEIKSSLPKSFDRLVLVAPFAKTPPNSGLLELFPSDGIVLIPAYDAEKSLSAFWRGAPALYERVAALFENPSVLHVDLATDIRRPMTAIVAKAAKSAGRNVLFVTDIDFREHPERARRLGSGFAKYAMAVVQRSFKAWQVKGAIKSAKLLLLKSSSMVNDFGRGREHVKNFFDVAHSESDVLTSDGRVDRLTFLADDSSQLKLCYFGRLVEYKGVDRMIQAVHLARKRGAPVSLKIVGGGPDLARLQAMGSPADGIQFVPEMPYGPALFEEISDCHMSVNTPLREDTPRSAFDALARGLPILAFDLSYFSDLSNRSGAVVLSEWPSSSALADEICRLCSSRDAIVNMAGKGLDFALANTQAVWIKRRTDWMNTYIFGESAQ